MRPFLAIPFVPLAFVSACVDAVDRGPGPAHGPTIPSGKGDCADCAARVSCVESAPLAGITTPLFADLDDPHHYYTLPTMWVSESASAVYALGSTLQIFEESEVPSYGRYTFSTHVALMNAEPDAAILAALRSRDPEATLSPAPIEASAIEALDIALAGRSPSATKLAWDPVALAADLHIVADKSAVESAVIFHGIGHGVLRVAARLDFVCEDELGPQTRAVHPQAGASVQVAYEGIPVDTSPSDMALTADQIMLQVEHILPLTFPDAPPLPVDDIRASVQRLTQYLDDVPVDDVQRIGYELEVNRLQPWFDVVATSPEAEDELAAIRFHLREVTQFKPHVRVYPVER